MLGWRCLVEKSLGDPLVTFDFAHASPLEIARLHYTPTLPRALEDLETVSFAQKAPSEEPSLASSVKAHFPNTFGQPLLCLKKAPSRERKQLRVGVVLSGGQAAGGHNVITGLFDALKTYHPKSELYGFLKGPIGIVEGMTKLLTEEELARYRNLGGFDLIGSGRTKVETKEQCAKALHHIERLALDGIVIIGGDDSNTNAALLAEFLVAEKSTVKVVGVPKTIDGDLKNEKVEISFGFDTACRVYAEMIGNLARDALSAKKYVHFVKLMGRSASHIALECALQAHPNVTLLSEEVLAKQQTMQQIVDQLVSFVQARSPSYGIVLIPEGLIEFIPEIKKLIAELNALLPKVSFENLAHKERIAHVCTHLDPKSAAALSTLPEKIQEQLLLDRDPHGNVQVSHIETEKLFSALVKAQVGAHPFHPLHHFFGYEGRAAFPSNFDATYCYALGRLAAALIHEGHTGYMSCLRHLARPATDWEVCALPITSLMHMEMRSGREKPVIAKALVDLQAASFTAFAEKRTYWQQNDAYRYVGPMQFGKDPALSEMAPLSLQLDFPHLTNFGRHH